MDTITKAAVRNLVESPARASKGNPVYAKQLVAALAGAKALGSDAHAYGVELALACRKATLKRDTLWQRKWGTRVSSRPGRGNHHDSWATREAYVRCSGSHRDYLEYAQTRLAEHPNWQFGTVIQRWSRKDSL
jgi:hypothetical protein